MVSIISPVYNEAENLDELYKRVVKALEGVGEDFEFILVENGSSDRSLEIIRDMRKKDRRVKYVSLSRNFGHQGAVAAGLSHSRGDAVITLDGDLQHPPELIPTLLKLWKEGHDVVYTLKKPTDGNKNWLNIPSRIFYRLISAVSAINLGYGQSDYRLMNRKVVDVILAMPEKNKFLRGIVSWVGFSQAGVEYEVGRRKRGRSKFSLWNYINFALDGIFSFSTVPLRIFLWFGLIIASLCGIWGIYYLVMGFANLLFPDIKLLPPGSATITISILFLGGVQLIGIGILGEYIGRIYSQTKKRPDFIVAEKELD